MESATKIGSKVLVKEEPVMTQERKQVGILGGNFNPVHLEHLLIAEQVGHNLGLDKVYLMPTFTPPHVDEKKTISADHRLRMLELAIADNSYLGIEKIELMRQGTSYTYETMKILKELHPDTDYYFIIGGDMVAYLPKWHKVNELMQLVSFVGVKRIGYPEESSYPVIWVDVPEITISSTQIRHKIKQGCSLKYLVPDPVLEYIYEEGLYRD